MRTNRNFALVISLLFIIIYSLWTVYLRLLQMLKLLYDLVKDDWFCPSRCSTVLIAIRNTELAYYLNLMMVIAIKTTKAYVLERCACNSPTLSLSEH